MKTLYRIIIDVLVFFFVMDLFSPVIEIGNGTFYQRIIYATAFAALMYIVPHVLLFFKIDTSEVTEFFLSAIFAFLFFFLGYYIFSFVSLTGTVLDTKIPLLEPINFVDKSIELLVIGALTAFLSIGVRYLSKKKKRSSSSLYS